MELSPMRYKGYVWPHNPEKYEISFARKVAVHKVPFGEYRMQDLGLSYRVMEGEGAFAGAGAYDEFKKLATVFYEGGAGTLVHPVWQTAQAYFVALTLVQEPLRDYVRYRFTFWEDCAADDTAVVTYPAAATAVTATAAAPAAEAAYHTVVQGDTLWAIAQRCGVSLSALLAVNPQIRNPNLIVVGEKVRLP